MNWEPGDNIDLDPADVPVLRWVASKQHSSISAERTGIVPFVGNLDIDTRAQVHNWIDTQIPGANKKRHLWIGRYLVAHAITLLLAYRMRPEDKPENEHHLLQQSWEVQVNTNFEDLPLQLADVDGECIRALERRMFEQSEAAGLAGFYQWGLDAGDHQNAWDPYANIPHDWNAGDLYPADMDELLVVRIHQTINYSLLGV